MKNHPEMNQIVFPATFAGRLRKWFFPALLCGILLVSQLRGAGQTYTWTTIAGSATNSGGSSDGTGALASFNGPWGVTEDLNGNLYVTDNGNDSVRMLTPVRTNWSVSTLVGPPGLSHNFQFNSPCGIQVSQTNSAQSAIIYVTDNYENEGSVWILEPQGVGTWQSTNLLGGFPGVNPRPTGLAVDAAGDLFTTLTHVNSIGEVKGFRTSPAFTILAGLASADTADSIYPGTSDGTNFVAQFNAPYGIGADTNNNIYIADTGNHTIRKMARIQGTTNWVTTTIAGTPGAFGTADGLNGNARFNGPDGVAVDAYGNIYISDGTNNTIRKMVPLGTNWMVSTIGGQTNRLGGHADGIGVASSFSHPIGLTVDAMGRIFVADNLNNTIRMGVPSAVTSAPPLLQLLPSTNRIAYVSWPVSVSGYVLQTSTNSTGPWVAVPAGNISTNHIYAIPMTNAKSFFRLSQ